MKNLNFLLIITLLSSLLACENELNETKTDIVTTPTLCPPSHPELQGSQYKFNGLESFTEITQTSLKLNWKHIEGFQLYHIIEYRPEGRKVIATLKAPQEGYTIKGLTPDKEYTYMVKAFDESGYSDINLNQLTISTLPWPYFNNESSLSFNGAQSVNIGNSSNFKLKNKMSFSLWFKTSDRHSHEARLITLHSKTDPSTAVSIGLQGDKIFSKFTDKNNILRTIQIDSNYFDNKWHQVGLSFNGSLYSLFIDGQLVAKYRGTLTGLGTSSAFIGSFSGIQKGFIGKIDEVSVYKTSLNRKDFNLLYNHGKADNLLNHTKVNQLVSWYQFGDNPKDSKDNIEDVVSNNNGTPLNIKSSDFILDAP
jgi:hypothetical protein